MAALLRQVKARNKALPEENQQFITANYNKT